MRADGPAEERQIAEQIQDLVADELVAVAEPVQRAAIAEHDRVVERAPARQTVLPHEPEVAEEAVRPGRGELLDERPLARRPGEDLRPDRRVVVVQRVADPQRVRRHDVNPPPGAAHSKRARKRQHPAARGLLLAARERQQRHEGLRAAVERGDLGPVHLDLDVVDAEPGRRRHEVLDGLDARRVQAQGRRVVRVDDALGPCRNPLAGCAHLEHDACIRRRGGDGDTGDLARVQADSFDTDRLSNGVLTH